MMIIPNHLEMLLCEDYIQYKLEILALIASSKDGMSYDGYWALLQSNAEVLAVIQMKNSFSCSLQQSKYQGPLLQFLAPKPKAAEIWYTGRPTHSLAISCLKSPSHI